MSSHNPTEHAVPATHQDDHPLPYGKIAGLGLFTLAIFGVAIVWSTHILNNTMAEVYPQGEPALTMVADGGALVDEPEIGIVNQRMFELDDRAAEKHEAGEKRLHSYDWDKATQVAHIPIERAMELIVQQHGGAK